MRRLLVPLAILVLATAPAACSSSSDAGASGTDDTGGLGGDDGPSGAATRIETSLQPASVQAGGEVVVTCTAFDAEGVAVDASAAEIQVNPAEGSAAAKGTLTFTKTGTYDVACALPSLDLVDRSPERVTVAPGPPARTVATVDPATTGAGETSKVSCRVEDALGNAIDGLSITVRVAPGSGVSVSGTEISTTKIGSYDVTCAPAGADVGKKEAATWTVTAGSVSTFALAFDPDKPAYKMDEKVKVSAVGLDAFGNAVPGLKITNLSATPDGSHKLSGDPKTTIRFDAEGIYDVKAELDDGSKRTATRQLVVDQTAPLITVTAPDRGITTNGAKKVTVEGTVSDNLGKVAWLRVGDLPVQIPPEGGSFSVEVDLIHGINMLVVSAADPWENTRTVGRSASWSSEWYALDPAAVESDAVGSGLVIVFTQEAIDDGDHDPTKVNDMATLFEIVLGSLDLSSLIPNPVAQQTLLGNVYSINIEKVSFSKPTVALTLVPGALHMKMVLQDFSADVVVTQSCTIPFICDPVAGTMAASSVTFDTDVEVSIAGGKTQADAKNTKVDIKDLTLQMKGLSGAALNWVLGLLTQGDFLANLLEGVLAGQIESQLAGTLGGLFEALAFNTEFDVPSPVKGQPANTLQLQSKPVAVQFTPESMRLALDAMANAVNPVRPHPVLGSLGFAGCGPAGQPPTQPPSPMQIALHDDLLNQILFGVWEGGTLSLKLGPDDLSGVDMTKYGIKDLDLTVDALVPMFFNSCGGEERLQIGDLSLDATFKLLGKPTHIAFWIQGEAPVEMAVVDNNGKMELGFQIKDLDPLVLEVVANEGPFEGDDASLEQLVRETLLPQLLGQLTGGLGSFPLPEIDLGSVSSQLPAGTTIALDIEKIDRNGAYILLQGRLK